MDNIAEMAAHAQAVDTRPLLSSHAAWVRGYLGKFPYTVYALTLIHTWTKCTPTQLSVGMSASKKYG